MVLWVHATYRILYISNCYGSMATKYGKLVTRREGFPLINSHNPLNMCSLGHVTNSKYVFTVTMLMVTRLIMVVRIARSFHPWFCMTLQWGGYARSRNKLNTLYLYLEKTDGRQTGKVLTCSERLSSLKSHNTLITWYTWGHVKILKNYILTIKRLMTSKPGKVRSYGRGFSTQMLEPLSISFWIRKC